MRGSSFDSRLLGKQLTIADFADGLLHVELPDRLGLSDPAFSLNKTLPVHRWVPWIAGFSSSFVRAILEKYARASSRVLDPFAGVGTTLVEAMLAGHSVTGFEINPYAALASKLKVTAHGVDLQRFHEEIERYRSFFSRCVSSDYVPENKAPSGFRTRVEFYSPRVLRKVLITFDFIGSIEDQLVADLFRLAFGSTMVEYSNYSYEPSLGTRVGAGKKRIVDYPVERAILHKLLCMSEDIQWIRRRLAGPARVEVINDSFFNYSRHLAPHSIDLVVTSPPYLNNYHYNRNTRPQLYWLGLVKSPRDLKRLEECSFGKYWQTVRGRPRIDLELPTKITDLEEQLEELRRLNPEKGVYGGSGWANYAASYFNDCFRFAEALHEVLKPGGRAFVVIGNSILQGVPIRTDEFLGRIAESAGLELVRIRLLREARVGNSIVRSRSGSRKATARNKLYESVVELRNS